MRIITAIEKYEKQEGDILVFLAGGITNCDNWQNSVIDRIKQEEFGHNVVIANPRRESFPDTNNEKSFYKQVEWEFNMLEQANIFSVFFANSESVQPITMYELGRNIVRMKEKFPEDYSIRTIISVQRGYGRTQDVLVQTDLAYGFKMAEVVMTPYTHAERIITAINECHAVIEAEGNE